MNLWQQHEAPQAYACFIQEHWMKYDEENSITLKSLAATESSRASAEAIRTWLNLEDTQSWRYQHARLAEKCVRGTGSWLFANDSFAQWKDPSSTETKVILITGKANRGKSCLTSAVIDHLRAGPVHPLAYHYLQNITNHSSSINLALRSIVWQLGQVDQDYYAFLSKACADGVGVQDAVVVWRKLLASYEPSLRTTFFVVLDGLDKSAAETLQVIIGEVAGRYEASTHEAANHEALTPSHLQIQLFLSGSPEAISLLEDAAAIHKITLDPGFDKEKMVANTDDVQELIRKRLGSMPIFRQEVTPFKKQQQQETMHTLTKHIQNDFAALDLVFEELERCTNLHQLKKALERVDEDMQVRFERHVDSLNQSLSQHEVLEINAIMTCIASRFGQNRWEDSSADCAPIELVQEYVDFSLRTPRLVSLKQQIEHSYHSILLVSTEGLVCWRHEELKTYLEKRSGDERAMRKILAKRAKRSDHLDLEELNLLEKVVQTNFTHVFGAYGTELFDKYGFTEFFASNREPYSVGISFAERESELSALLMCLKIICEDPDIHRFQELRSHALNTVYQRLKSVGSWGCDHDTSEEYISPWPAPKQEKTTTWPGTKQEKIAVGRFVAKILRNDAVIDAYARDGPGSIADAFGHWQQKGRFRWRDKDYFYEWLIGLQPDDLENREEKEWFRTWKSGAGSCWDYVSNRLARRWLKMGNEEWSTVEDFIDGTYIHEKYTWLCDNFANDGPETLQRITKLIIELCEERNIKFDLFPMIRACEKVFNVSDKTWWALFFAAKSLADSNDRWDPYMDLIRKAHGYLEVAMSLELFEDEDYTNRYWREMLPLFARCQICLGDLPGGKKTYIYMMNSPQSWELMKLRLFVCFEPPIIMELLNIAQSVLVMESSGHSLYHQMLSGDLEEEDLLPLRLAAHNDGNWQSIVGLIEHSTLVGPNSQMLWSTMAGILWHESGDTHHEDRALEIWKQGKDTQAIVDALLGRAISEVPHNPLGSYSFERLKRMHPEISDPTEDHNISFRAKVMVAGWQHQSGQVTEAREFISTLIGHRNYLSEGRPEHRELLAEWGLACIALGNEDLGALLLEQIPIVSWFPHSYHGGCIEICARQTDDAGQSNGLPILLCCKTCLAVIRPKCCATIEKGVRLPDLCEPGHEYLPIRELRVLIVEEEAVACNYGGLLHYDDETRESYTWAPENNGINRAQQLYGWAKPVYQPIHSEHGILDSD